MMNLTPLKFTGALGGAAAVLLTATFAQAESVDATATFTGAILDTCAVTIPTQGGLGASADATRLASDEAGGQAAQAQVVTNNPRATLQVIAPTAFLVSPNGSDANTTFEASHTIDGTETEAGLTTLLPVGITQAAIDASATKTEGAFEGGAYSMVVTVRCITQ